MHLKQVEKQRALHIFLHVPAIFIPLSLLFLPKHRSRLRWITLYDIPILPIRPYPKYWITDCSRVRLLQIKNIYSGCIALPNLKKE